MVAGRGGRRPGVQPGTVQGLTAWLEDPAEDRGIHTYEDGRWVFRSYLSLAARTFQIVRRLADCGVGDGDRVAVLAADHRDFFPAFFSVLLRGATAVPIAPMPPRGETYVSYVSPLLQVAEPSAILAQPALMDALPCDQVPAADCHRLEIAQDGDAVSAELASSTTSGSSSQADSAAVLQFTSGSSAPPRAVAITYANLAANIGMTSEWEQTDPARDAVASWLPWHHDMGLVGHVVRPATWQIDVWHMPPLEFLRNPAEWLRCLGLYGATLTAAPMFGYSYAARRVAREDLEGCDFAEWHSAVVGAERIDPVGLRRFFRLLGEFAFRADAFRPAYGLAEATLAVTGVPRGDRASMIRIPSGCGGGHLEAPVAVLEPTEEEMSQAGGDWVVSSGRPLAGISVTVVDDDLNPVEDGQLGEIVVQGESVGAGYVGDVRQAGSRFRGDALLTGDAGMMIEGELYVLGRMTDSIKVRGRRVFVEPLEAVVAEVAGVSPGQCAVIPGVSRDRDEVAAIVEGDGGSWIDTLDAVLRQRLGTGVLVSIRPVPRHTIPKTTSGKLRRRELWWRLQRGELDEKAGSRDPAFRTV